MFECDKCGLCCRSLDNSSLYKEYDRGDGTCRYYNEKTKLCSIYNERPLICNIDKFYDIHLKNKVIRKEYYKLNYEACKKLKSNN